MGTSKGSPKSITKSELSRYLAEKLKTTKTAAAEFLDELSEMAIRETKKNGIFILPGIGRLVKAHRNARMGRNPATGQPLKIAARTVVKFRVAKVAKDAIAGIRAA
jgi:DNA-binding protein HU-beta